jgi:hypothetical protein
VNLGPDDIDDRDPVTFGRHKIARALVVESIRIYYKENEDHPPENFENRVHETVRMSGRRKFSATGIWVPLGELVHHAIYDGMAMPPDIQAAFVDAGRHLIQGNGRIFLSPSAPTSRPPEYGGETLLPPYEAQNSQLPPLLDPLSAPTQEGLQGHGANTNSKLHWSIVAAMRSQGVPFDPSDVSYKPPSRPEPPPGFLARLWGGRKPGPARRG